MYHYLANGHQYHLYAYSDLPEIPKGTVSKDANEILPAPHIFQNSKRNLCLAVITFCALSSDRWHCVAQPVHRFRFQKNTFSILVARIGATKSWDVDGRYLRIAFTNS